MAYRALAEAVELFATAECRRSEDRALVERYLAALAPVLAGAALGRDVLDGIAAVERLFGQSWLVDATPFEPAFRKWREFREQHKRFAVRGMTVNERLFAFSLLDDFDRAAASNDIEAMRRILESVHVDRESIARILARHGGDAK